MGTDEPVNEPLDKLLDAVKRHTRNEFIIDIIAFSLAVPIGIFLIVGMIF